MEFYDIHTHILPGVDDGPDKLETSVKMLMSLYRQGVKNVALTPHYYSNEEPMEDFILRRREAFEILKPHIPPDMKILIGSEVYVTDYLFNNRDVAPLCMGKGYMLTELPYEIDHSRALKLLEKVISNYCVTPIIAHIERYKMFTGVKSISEAADMGCLIQVNLNSFENIFSSHRVTKLIKNGLVDFVATDAHSMGMRRPDYVKYIEVIKKKIGIGAVRTFMDNAGKIGF